jgi:P4 family phage/plasmid primase-like protien
MLHAYLSIVARSIDRDLVHELFQGKEGYQKEALDTLIDDACQASGPRTCKSIDQIRGSEECKRCPHWQKQPVISPIFIQENFIETEAAGFWETKLTLKGEPIPIRPCYKDLAKAFERDHAFMSVSDSGQIYVHEDHQWKPRDPLLIKAFAEDKMKPEPRENQRNEFWSLLKVTNLRHPDWFNESTEDLINLRNGVFNVQKKELKPHSKEYGFKYVLPFSYDEKADCPLFRRFLREVTCDRSDLVQVIVEFMGYSLANGPCLGEKAMILHGEGENGKSTLMKIWRDLAGKDNYSELSLSALNKDTKRFMVDGKLFNMGEETNVRALADSEVFKTMVTGGSIDVKQLYAQDYSIENRCKLIMACNTLPKSSDRTHGLYRRMLLIPFDAVFSKALGNRDPRIYFKMKDELPGIFNMAIAGYGALAENDYNFSHSETIDKQIEDFKLENDNVLLWMKERLQWSGDASQYISKDKLYEDYKGFADGDGLFVVSKVVFFKTLSRRLPSYKENKREILEGRKRVVYGVSLSDKD